MALVIGVGVVLGAAAAIFAASKLGGDPEVMDDIDRHFEMLAAPPAQADGKQEEVERPSSVRRSTRVVAVAGPQRDEKKRATAQKEKAHRSWNVQAQKIASPVKAEAESRWRGIRQVAPGTYLVAEKLVADARKQPGKYLQGARAAPEQRGGNLIGFRLFNIAKGSALHALGFRDRDILVGVNGHELTSVDEALLAAGTLRFAKKYRFDLLRGGTSRSLYYRIDPD